MDDMARPNRSEERRAEILDAAIDLIERHDVATLRMVDVAAAAGMTSHALRYYFSDLDELLSMLALRSDTRFLHARLALADTTRDIADRLARTIAAGLPEGADDAEWRAIWRAVLAAGFELDRRRDVQGIFHRQVQMYADLLAEGAAAGAFQLRGTAHDIAMTLMSLEDYLGFRVVARDPAIDRPTALRLMRNYAEAMTSAALPEVP